MKKNLAVGILLSFIGPLGMLYTSITGFLAFLVINILLIFLGYIIKISTGGYEILYILLFSTVFFAVSYSYNVITENNRRISAGLKTMSQNEELVYGFSNIKNIITTLLIALFITCFLYAVCSLTKIFNSSNEKLQIIFSILIFSTIYIYSVIKGLNREIEH